MIIFNDMHPIPTHDFSRNNIFHSDKEILLLQSRGKFLTKEEKERAKNLEMKKRKNVKR